MARLNVNLPADLHREAKAEAARLGMTLTDFVIAAVRSKVAEFRRRRLLRLFWQRRRSRFLLALTLCYVFLGTKILRIGL